MAAEQTLKASEKQDISKKLMTLLKKQYGSAIPKQDRPVLETIIFAICLEDNSIEEANTLYERLQSSFCDLNEMRVSSITELVEVIGEDENAEYRALRVRSLLQYVFEDSFSYDLEQFTRKTQDQAQKFLAKIPHLSHFVRQYVLLSVLGAHVVPVDSIICQFASWLGFVKPGTAVEKASDSLKSSVRKTDAPLLFHLFRLVSCDDKKMKIVNNHLEMSEGESFDLLEAPKRCGSLLAGKLSVKKKQAPKAEKKTTAKKATKTAKKTVKKSAKKTVKKTVKKKVVKKAVPKKATKASTVKKKAAKTVKKKVVKAAKKKAKTAKKKSKKK